MKMYGQDFKKKLTGNFHKIVGDPGPTFLPEDLTTFPVIDATVLIGLGPEPTFFF
jgi:hypothetical protein